jgi:hypothetical protein
MRIRRETAPRRLFVAEVGHLPLAEPAFKEPARVDARRGVALEVDQVGIMAGVFAAEEVVEADFVQRGRRRVRRHVAADAVRLAVGLDDHGRGVPTDEALDAALDLAVARVRHLRVRRNGVEIGGVRGEGFLHARLAGPEAQSVQEPNGTAVIAAVQNVIKRVNPLARFNGL